MSMVRDTSKKAYKDLNADGTGRTQREQILCIMSSNGDMSLREIQSLTRIDINAVAGRVNDLKKEGAITGEKKRYCHVTGRLVTPVRAAEAHQRRLL